METSVLRRPRLPIWVVKSSSRSFFCSCETPRRRSSTGRSRLEEPTPTYTVSVLSKGYGPWSLLNVAWMVPVAPGLTGSRVHSGIVQPQEEMTLWMTSGALPMFVKVKMQLTGPSAISTSPKSWTFRSKRMTSASL